MQPHPAVDEEVTSETRHTMESFVRQAGLPEQNAVTARIPESLKIANQPIHAELMGAPRRYGEHPRRKPHPSPLEVDEVVEVAQERSKALNGVPLLQLNRPIADCL